MLGVGVGFITMAPVLWSPKYIYNIQTDTNLMSINRIDCYDGKLQEPHLRTSFGHIVINFLTLLELFSGVLKMANTTCKDTPLCIDKISRHTRHLLTNEQGLKSRTIRMAWRYKKWEFGGRGQA